MELFFYETAQGRFVTMTGTIFDIQRFALHDGPGIRTTVFLKGCPLNCLWCCNPESQNPSPQLGYDENKCIHCLKCTVVCPTGALSEKDSRLTVDFSLCNACGKCVGECHEAALRIYGYEADSEDIMQQVVRDKEYFDNSGGGLTISGGDPLFQPEFTIELLKKAKALNINTCIETSAFASKDVFEKLLPLVDFFYIDYKITGNNRHKEYTGIPSKQVLANIDFLCCNNAHVVLRCTIIPEINDTVVHFRAITDLSKKYDAIKQVHVLPYHRYGELKYKHIGMEMPGIGSVSVNNEWEIVG
jgi:glycyl-radical enzyme activating protein